MGGIWKCVDGHGLRFTLFIVKLARHQLKTIRFRPYPRLSFFFIWCKCKILNMVIPYLKAIVKFYYHLSLTNLYQFGKWKLGLLGMEDTERQFSMKDKDMGA